MCFILEGQYSIIVCAKMCSMKTLHYYPLSSKKSWRYSLKCVWFYKFEQNMVNNKLAVKLPCIFLIFRSQGFWTRLTHVPSYVPGSLTSGFLRSQWRGKRSRHSQRMRNPQFYVSGKRPIVAADTWVQYIMDGWDRRIQWNSLRYSSFVETDLRYLKFFVVDS